MGIPKFYRWLSERYPMVNQVVQSGKAPEFDCLYLDMNGIIHQCTHPSDLDLLTTRLTEDQMFSRIFEYIDRIFHLVTPKKLLFMAVDGVAPRAKMNQQRSRRFKSANEMKEAIATAKRTGQSVSAGKPFDSNCITPGTEFMEKVCRHLRFFVRKKMEQDAAWRRCAEVILSGPDVPGEGEHKIMLYIRRMKMMANYPGNLRHCLYGLDADLIMLGLVTHEPHFALLREEVIFGSRNNQPKRKSVKKAEKFQLLHISILREYLQLEYKGIRLKPKAGPIRIKENKGENKNEKKEDHNEENQQRKGALVDVERVIDDFVFLCFFVGNDFIPNIPMLDIAENGLDLLVQTYKGERDGGVRVNFTG
jgi:5'-3' exoribonuclease 1